MHKSLDLHSFRRRHAFVFGLMSVLLIFVIHHLPFNHLFIDAFGEAIKYHDVTDIGLSKFRDHADPDLYDERVIIINTMMTDREQVTDVINYVTQFDVASIGVDLLFDQLQDPSIDSALAAALTHPKVVLGYSFDESKSSDFHQQGNYSNFGNGGVRSHTRFSTTAQEAYVNLGTIDGLTVRAFQPFWKQPNGKEALAFSVQLVNLLDPNIVQDLKSRSCEREWINFRRPQVGSRNMTFPINPSKAIQYPYFYIDQLLKDRDLYGNDFWKDKTVLLGFNGRDDDDFSMNDRYYTPLNQRYYGRSLPDMHGVMIHANIVSMLLDRDFIYDVPLLVIYLGCFLIFCINYLIFIRVHKKRFFVTLPVVRVIQLIQFVLLISFCIIMIAYANIKVGFILLIISSVMSYEFFEFYIHRIHERVHPFWSKKITTNE